MRPLGILGLSLLLAASTPPGKFDYYVLSLSWSPEYCTGPGGARNPAQCGEGRRYGFVVHGLWPQFEKGWPEDCAPAAPLPRSLVEKMLPIMPSEQLIRHEWAKHGTCAGLDPTSYFNQIEKAFSLVRIPPEFQSPLQHVSFAPETVRQKFTAVNPGMMANAIQLRCNGRYLREVHICLTRDLKPRPCTASVGDTCPSSTLILRPVR